MKNILVVSSGKVNGNTDALTNSFIKGAKEEGHHISKIVLTKHIAGCMGCGYCQKNTHQCAICDDMQEYYELFLKADLIVFASPLYFWSLSGRLKSFIDRLYAISTNDEYPYKETMLLMTCGSDGFYAFEQAVSYYRFYTNALGWDDKGMVLAKACKEHPQYINEQYLQEAYQLGRNYQ